MNLTKAKHAFITGGASGIGLGIAEAFGKRGIAVTLADIDREMLAEVVASHRGQFGEAMLDVRDRQAWAGAKAAAEAQFGPVDILVNSAGIGPDGRSLAEMDATSFDRVIAINLTGVFNGVSAFAAGMQARGAGYIVNVASMAGLVAPAPNLGAYTAAKFGVVGLSEVLRAELAPHKVGVSVLCPGLVATNIGATTVKLGSAIRNVGAAMSGGLDPRAVGEFVVAGISEDRFYLATHPERWPAVEKRMRELEDAFKPR